MNDLAEKIKLKQMEINIENDPARKQELQRQLRKLQLQNEIERIRKTIEQIG